MMEEEEGQKGKGKQVVAAPRDPVKVRARLSDRGTDVVVLVDKDENVKVVVQRILEEAGVSSYTGFHTLACAETNNCSHDRFQPIPESDWRIWARCSRKQPLLPHKVGSQAMSSMPWSFDGAMSQQCSAYCELLMQISS